MVMGEHGTMRSPITIPGTRYLSAHSAPHTQWPR
jgi:hypothetical protein